MKPMKKAAGLRTRAAFNTNSNPNSNAAPTLAQFAFVSREVRHARCK